MRILRNTLASLSSLCVLLSCTPTFKTTEQLCQAYLPTTQAVKNYDVNAGDSDYTLYLEDFLNTFRDTQSKSVALDGTVTLSPLSADEQAVKDFIFARIQQNMSYTLENDVVVSTDNPLDFIESIIASTDPDVIVGTFTEAKSQMASAIAKDNGHCTYSNDQILFRKEAASPSTDLVDFFQAQLDLVYVPSNFVEGDNKVDQTVLLTFDRDPDAVIEDKVSYSALDRIAPENFEAEGFSTAKVRQISVKALNSSENFIVDEDYVETKTGTLAYSNLNVRCRNDEGELSTCAAGTNVKDVEHPACEDGIDSDGEGFANPDVEDENNTVEFNTFDIVTGNPQLEQLQRLKVEVDYPNNEIRVFVSKFGDAIYKALDVNGDPILQGDDNPTPSDDDLIYNPTNCEITAVSKDLFELQSAEDQAANITVPATTYLDPNFDLITDTDVNGDPVYTDPNPLFVFQGTAILDRQ